jgi:putative ABC transport system ATP-binding protein
LVRAGRTVLESIDLEIPDHGITVIVGPTGAGKSSVARLCNRLLDPTTGTVRFNGDDLRDLDVLRLRRRVGLVLQRPTVFPGSVVENLESGLEAEPAAGELADLLTTVGLDPALLERDDALALSGGQAQLLCLARTMATRPDVLVADEPTASVDAAVSRQIERLVRDIAADGMPVVWITHDLAQMTRLADHLVVIVEGRVAAAGTSAEVTASPDPVVRDLLRHGSNQLDRDHTALDHIAHDDVDHHPLDHDHHDHRDPHDHDHDDQPGAAP